jgi:N-acetylmuramoyl-L-alanine amidase
MTDLEIRAMLDDTQALALTLWGEGRGEEVEGRIAIACVVRNRMNDDRWPDTLKDVCLQKSQFSCWDAPGGAQNYRTLLAVAERLVTDGATSTDRVLKESLWVAEGIASGVVRDRVAGGNHYITRHLWETARPKWIGTVTPNCLIGRHAFFKL